jgi:GTP pyrophosphokinase
MWKPITDRFKDYISTPKSNGYQSLHTTVVGTGGPIIEMQIRTWDMNHVAEDGIAAHWLYKTDEKTVASQDDKAIAWLKNIIEWQKDLTDSNEFLEFFKIDLFHAEIFVFTPKGDLISLPKGATVLDFAFAVHTHIGLRCIGARVDGKMESINTVLHSGSTVEILHHASKIPSVDWMREVRTPKARTAIRHWLKTTTRQESIDLGKKIIKGKFRKLHSDHTFMDHVPALLQTLGLKSLERLYEAVGSGEISIDRLVQYFEVKKVRRSVSSRVVSSIVRTIMGPPRGVIVGGSDNLMVRFAHCCNPVPGDAIIGFVTRGRGISVHRKDCPNSQLFVEDAERTIDVSWDDTEVKKFTVSLTVSATDRPGLLHDITTVFSDIGINVLQANIRTNHGRVTNTFDLEIINKNQLKQMLRRIQHIKGVESALRSREAWSSPSDTTTIPIE